LIQHRHKANEIAGVTTYIELFEAELKLRGIESQIVSTAETTVMDWVRSILWSDVVYMHSNNPAFVLLSRLLGRKVFLMYHYKFYLTECLLQDISLAERLKIEIKHLATIQHLPLKWKLERGLQVLRLVSRLAASYGANELLANTEFMASSTCLPKTIHVSPYPCPQDSAPKAKTLQNISHPLTFTFAGRLCKEKGVDILLMAVKKLATQHANFRVNIIGSGELAAKLQETIDALQLNETVQLLGRLSLEETMEQMRNSLAVVVPSRWQEPAGRVLLEAATVGTSVIASKVGGLPELGGDECLYFEKEDVEGLYQAMDFCLRDPQYTLDLGLKLQSRIQEQHSIARHVDDLMDLFNK
jgi:glycogen synthase